MSSMWLDDATICLAFFHYGMYLKTRELVINQDIDTLSHIYHAISRLPVEQ